MTTQVISVGVLGAGGYAGQDLVQLLLEHPHVSLQFVTSSRLKGNVLPGTALRYREPDEIQWDGIDAVFLALPHRASAPYAKQARAAGLRVIDLSADLRLDNAETYETWYQTPHPHPELLPVPYGLPEMYRHEIQGCEVVAVPGCYPTASLLGLYPLLRTESLSLDNPVIIDAKSGVSGAGQTPTERTHFVEVYGNIVPYNVGRVHRHVGEIEQELMKFSPLKDRVIFSPHLVPIDRGLMATIVATLNYSLTSDRVYNLYNNVYGDEALIQLKPLGTMATFRDQQLKNGCSISITPVDERHVIIVSVIDNLRKGAASQAVQCFNLMFDLPETTALL